MAFLILQLVKVKSTHLLMTKLSNIIYPHLLIMNNHLNFFGIEFDDESLLDFINTVDKYSFVCKMVDNICSTQEFTEHQKTIIKKAFPNLNLFIKN